MKFCNNDVPENYYRGKKFITIGQITKMYGMKDSARVSSIIHKLRANGTLVSEVDYFHLSMNECGLINGIDHQRPVPRGQHVLTEKGYRIVQPKLDAWKERNELAEAKKEQEKAEVIKPEKIRVLNEELIQLTEELAEKPVENTEPVVEDTVMEEFGATTSATVTNVNFTEMVGLMNKTLDMLANVIAQQSEDHKEMVRQLSENNKEVCKLLSSLSFPRQQSKVEEKDDYIIDTSYVADYQTWKKNINKAVDKIAELTGQTKNEVLSDCYKALTKEYGYVFDDIAKKFYNEYGRGPINSLENVWYGEQNNPAYKNLMIAKLSGLYREAEKKNEANS